MRRLAADYAYDFRAVAPFFAGDPSRSRRVGRRDRPHAGTRPAARRDRRRHRRRSRSGARRRRGRVEAARQLADPRTVAVVTGQQAGLFGGPLFTLLKALTALKLAEQVSREHNVPAVAVFWIDAEDHDWDEVRSCTVFDETLTPRTVSLPPRAGAEPAPVATVRLDDSILDALDELEQHPAADRIPSRRCMADLRRAYAPGVGMADAFGRWLEQVLGDRGLVVYDSSDPASKPLVAQRVRPRAVDAGRRPRSSPARPAPTSTTRGYHSQVQLAGRQPRAVPPRRQPAARSASRTASSSSATTRIAPATLVAAGGRPARPRSARTCCCGPIVQDTLFPTICYVAGPNELAYLGQLRGVYEHFGVPMPLMYPRASATLVDSAALRFLTKYDVPLEALQAQDEAALNELLKTQIPADGRRVVQRTPRSAIDDAMTRVIARDAGARSDARRARPARRSGRMQHDLQTLHGKMIQAAKRRDETLRRQFIHARALAFPGGHAQERTIGFVSFLNQYGPALVERLDDELPLDLGQHWVVAI